MQQRYYDPFIGRFYSNDPVDILEHMQRGNSPANGFNRYAYANNNPYKYVDPDGEFGIFGALISAGIEIAVQSVQVAKGGSYDVGKIAISALAGGAGVGLGQKAAQLGSLLSNGSKVAATTSQVAGAVTEAVAINVIETSANNIVNSITGDKPIENINAQGATTNAVTNTAVGNIADNKIGASGTKKADLVKGAAEGLRKSYEEYKKISIRDLKLIKEFKFNKRSFDWTLYALFRLNLIAIVTAFVFEVQKGFELEEFLTGSLYLLGIATAVSITLIPCVDVYNFLLDKKVCRLMGWNYDEYYVRQYSTKQAEKLRENYAKMAEADKDLGSMKTSIEELGKEFRSLTID